VNNRAKFYSNKFIRIGITGFSIGVWWVIKLWGEIYLPLLLLFATANIAWLFINISLSKKLRQKMESEAGSTQELPEKSSQSYWVMFILIGLTLSGSLLSRNYNVGLQFILVAWVVLYSVWLYYEVKRANKWLKYW
jgi:hypothetical protein